MGRGCPSVPACACVLPPPPGPLLPLPPITAPLRTRLVEGAERSLACPAPRDKNTAWLPAGTVRRSPPGLVGGRRRRGNAALPDPPSPPPPPAVRRPGGSAAWASPAAQPQFSSVLPEIVRVTSDTFYTNDKNPTRNVPGLTTFLLLPVAHSGVFLAAAACSGRFWILSEGEKSRKPLVNFTE